MKPYVEAEKIINCCLESGIIPTGTIFTKNSDEVIKIINKCRELNIEPSGTVFLRTAEEIETISAICDCNGIKKVGCVFGRKPDEIETIVKLCKEKNITISGSFFKRSVEDIKEIFALCKDYDIDFSVGLLKKDASSLKESIEYVKETYGDDFVLPLIVNKSKSYLEKVLPYIDSRGELDILKTSTAILSLSMEEIIERENFIRSVGYDNVTGDRFNAIYGLSKNRYATRKMEILNTSGFRIKK